MEKYLRITILVICLLVLVLLGYQFFQLPEPMRNAWWTGVMIVPNIFWIIFMKLEFVGRLIVVLGVILLLLIKIHEILYQSKRR